MSKSVNVDFVTRQIEVDTDGKEHFISAAMAAKDAEQSMLNAQNAANTAQYYSSIVEGNISYVTPEMFGALGNGVYDDAIAINKALEYGSTNNMKVMLESHTYYIKSPIILNTQNELVGASRINSVLRLADGANCNIIESYNFRNCLTNKDDTSKTEYQPYRIYISDFKIEGNAENNTQGGGIYLFATASTIENIFISNVADCGIYIGLRDRWVVGSINNPIKQALVLSNIDIYQCGEHGIFADYAHDTYYNNIVVCNASQKAEATYDDFHLGAGSGGRMVHCHGWSANNGFRGRYSLYHEDNSPLEVTESHFEGSKVGCAYITAAAVISNTRFYVAYSEHMITVAGSLNSFVNCVFMPNTTRNTYCVRFLNDASLNRFCCTITDNIKFADDGESGGKNNYNLMSLTNNSTKMPIDNLQSTSIMSVNTNYTGNYSPATMYNNGSISTNYDVKEPIGYYENPTDVIYIRNERYIIVNGNSNNKTCTLSSANQPIGKTVTIRNISNAALSVFMSSDTIVDGVVNTNPYVSANSSKTYIKVDENKWITM